MCDALTIAGLALSLGGVGLQGLGAKKASKAQAAVGEAELRRQRGFGEESAGVFDASLGKFGRGSQDARRESRAAVREAAVDANVGANNPAVPVVGSAPTVVKNTIARSIRDAIDFSKDQGRAQGRLSSFGDLAFDNNVDLTRSGISQARIGGFSRGSSGVVPLELADAANSGSGLRSFGGLLRGAGTVASLAGVLGAAGGVGAPTALGPQAPTSFGNLFAGPGFAAPFPRGIY